MSARVLITGANGGIGTAAMAELRSRGARVVGLDLVADDDADVLACDLRDADAVQGAVDAAVERLGGLDVLINNAGLGMPQSAGQAPDADALAVLDVNLIAPWRVSAAALPHLRASHGRVVNVASGLAHLAVPFATAYCMSKRGLVAYSDALRLEYGDEITVTTVYPGYIRTGIHDAAKEGGVGLEGAVPGRAGRARGEDARARRARAPGARPRHDPRGHDPVLPRPPLAAAAARRADEPRRAADGPPRALLGPRHRGGALRALVGSLRRSRLARMPRDGWSALFTTRVQAVQEPDGARRRGAAPRRCRTPPTCGCSAGRASA